MDVRAATRTDPDRLTQGLRPDSVLAPAQAPAAAGGAPLQSLHDPRLRHNLDPGGRKGSAAVFRRRQRIQFQQDGVGAILDHFWGDGVTTASYTTSAGRIIDSFKDAGRRHLVIQLEQSMRRGQILEFTVERHTLEAFTQADEWSEMTIDHPIAGLSQVVRFPKARPCQAATLQQPGGRAPLHVLETAEGLTEIGLRIPKPKTDTPYRIQWTW